MISFVPPRTTAGELCCWSRSSRAGGPTSVTWTGPLPDGQPFAPVRVGGGGGGEGEGGGGGGGLLLVAERMTAVGFDDAAVEPSPFVASTANRIVWPTSAATSL